MYVHRSVSRRVKVVENCMLEPSPWWWVGTPDGYVLNHDLFYDCTNITSLDQFMLSLKAFRRLSFSRRGWLDFIVWHAMASRISSGPSPARGRLHRPEIFGVCCFSSYPQFGAYIPRIASSTRSSSTVVRLKPIDLLFEHSALSVLLLDSPGPLICVTTILMLLISISAIYLKSVIHMSTAMDDIHIMWVYICTEV